MWLFKQIRVLQRLMCLAVLQISMLLAAGCSGSGGEELANTDKATEALNKALTAWKDGKKIEELKPAIYVQDADWMQGGKLSDFSVVSPGEVVGANYSVQVELTLTGTDGKGAAKKVWYLVGTSPETTVIRDILHP